MQNINDERTNRILGTSNRVLLGEGVIRDKIHELAFEISPLSFFQNNPSQTDVLYSKALEYCELTGSETVFDIYCGIGTISLFLAGKAAKVVGFEDLGMEAIYEFDVVDMPVTVAVDAGGTSAHITGPAEWQKRIATGEFKGISVNAG